MTSVEKQVSEVESVYVGRRRGADLMPGVSFRIAKVLKGRPVSNLRVPVASGGEASCGTTVPVGVDYVLLASGGGVSKELNLCNESLRGAGAVAEAVEVLGAGLDVPSRVDMSWLLPWMALAGAVLLGGAGVGVAVRRRVRP